MGCAKDESVPVGETENVGSEWTPGDGETEEGLGLCGLGGADEDHASAPVNEERPGTVPRSIESQLFDSVQSMISIFVSRLGEMEFGFASQILEKFAVLNRKVPTLRKVTKAWIKERHLGPEAVVRLDARLIKVGIAEKIRQLRQPTPGSAEAIVIEELNKAVTSLTQIEFAGHISQRAMRDGVGYTRFTSSDDSNSYHEQIENEMNGQADVVDQAAQMKCALVEIMNEVGSAGRKIEVISNEPRSSRQDTTKRMRRA